MTSGGCPSRRPGSDGQSLVLVVAGLCGLLIGALVLAAVARGIGVRSDAQRAADLGALAGARAMLAAYPRLFEPAVVEGRPNPNHLEKATYLELGRAAAVRVVRVNGVADASVAFPDADELAPVRIRVDVRRRVEVERASRRAATELAASAEAELSPVSQDVGPGAAGGDYGGPLATRQGKRMRPDVAAAFDRMQAAAGADGIALIVNSGYRSDAEQAVLFAQHPDPKWVAPPGKSLHRYGTELDLGPPSAYGWLAANASRFHFVQRYAWEAWHYGYVLNPKSSPSRRTEDADGHGSMPAFVPARFEQPIASAAQRYNVSATLLAAQLYQESKFNPFAVSGAGAQGIAQFMPGTAAAYGLRNPFDAERAIDAQARLMRDLLRQFAAIPLALAAYNAGPAPVAACGCVPPFAETQGYVAAILGLMSGAGDVGGAALAVRLVR
jgi:Transglycosylase SLT domain/D-alanyl-D-alanine carboxypeptidase